MLKKTLICLFLLNASQIVMCSSHNPQSTKESDRVTDSLRRMKTQIEREEKEIAKHKNVINEIDKDLKSLSNAHLNCLNSITSNINLLNQQDKDEAKYLNAIFKKNTHQNDEKRKEIKNHIQNLNKILVNLEKQHADLLLKKTTPLKDLQLAEDALTFINNKYEQEKIKNITHFSCHWTLISQKPKKTIL